MYDIPEALPYVITPKAAQENSPILQLLPHWAPCSITRALEFLSPVYKRHPRIMAYVLRVLESYPAECVTFFMPQLVQILRYDDGVSYFLIALLPCLGLGSYIHHFSRSWWNSIC
jgi:phosphatidylinositol 4-kinase